MRGLYLWFWRLLPANPMAVRIVRSGSLRSRHLWVRMGYLGALILLVLIGLLQGGGLGGAMSLTDLAKAGTHIFAIVAYGQIVLVCLLAPLFMAGAIAQEQQGKTFDILLTTPLSNLQIVLGSFGGRLFFVLALLLSGLPLFAVLLIFGGVPINSVFVSFAVAALVAVMVGSVAIAMSVLRLGGRKTVFTFVIVIAAYLIGAYLLDVEVLRQLPATRLAPNGTTWLTPLHPLLVLEASLNSANYHAPGPEYLTGYPALLRFYLGQPLAAFAALSLLVSVFLLVLSALVLRQAGQGVGAMRRLGQWLRGRLGLPGAGTLPGGRRRAAREVWANPIAWREAHTRGRLAAGVLARWGFVTLGIIAVVTLLVLYHTGTLPTLPGPTGQPMPVAEVFHSMLVTLLVVEVAVVSLVALYMSAGAISREREDGTLDLMLATPITPRQYMWGKLRGLVSFLSLLIAVPVVTLAVVSGYALLGKAMDWPQAMFTYHGLNANGAAIHQHVILLMPEAAALLALMLVPFVALCVATGMNWSLKSRGVLGAVVPAVAVIGTLTLVLGLCGLSAAAEVPLVGPVLNAFSPVTNLMMLIEPWQRVSGFASNPAFGRVSLATAAVIAAGGYGLIVYAMLMGMVKGFDQTVRRLSGTG